MKENKLIITGYHRNTAKEVFEYIKKTTKLLKSSNQPLVITISGESGCGKTGTAIVLAELCEEEKYKTVILQQDDYFVYPPETNHNTRLKDINWVGIQEVKLDLIDQNIVNIKNRTKASIRKPLVIYEENRITEEEVETTGIQVIIVEGTYATLLNHADIRVFIDRTYRQTKKARLARARDPANDFIERVLEIEHEIISRHKKQADIIIAPPERKKQ